MPKKKKDIEYFEAVGRRKSATARVRLYIFGDKKTKTITINSVEMKPGDIVVNKLSLDKYFPSEAEKNNIFKPLNLTKSLDRFAISVIVRGGGKNGQLDSVVHGLSRALCEVDETYRLILKPEGLLSRDPRIRERRMVGTGGKSRRKKQSPKR